MRPLDKLGVTWARAFDLEARVVGLGGERGISYLTGSDRPDILWFAHRGVEQSGSSSGS